MKIGFVSLGCSKNLVDTEKTIGIFKANNYEIVNKPEEADVIVINTCGFIESAKEEAINTILEMAEYKKKKCKYLIVMGCLVERYKEELEKAIPEVDLWIKYSEYNSLWRKIQELLNDENNPIQNKANCDIKNKQNQNSNKYEKFDQVEERVVSTGNNYAYLKIADGCSNRCTYCAIPYIRGPQISRKMEDIIKEANKLANDGYKELILIAQDTTKYGTDIYGKPMLVELMKEISKIDKIKWIRFLYAYPETISDELIKLVKEDDKICKYFDIPIQHISDTVLKRMNRQSDGKSIRKLISKIRKEIPEVVLRTTVMVGFPGETKEDGTPAARIKEQIHPMTKKSRYNKIMSLQKEISKQNLEKRIGQQVEVLIEDKTFDGKTYIGRTYMDVPDIDGIAYLNTNKKLQKGDFAKAKIVDVSNYDLILKD